MRSKESKTQTNLRKQDDKKNFISNSYIGYISK